MGDNTSTRWHVRLGVVVVLVGVSGIERLIAWGCARAVRALGDERAITYLSEKARPQGEPLAREAIRLAGFKLPIKTKFVSRTQ